MIAGSFGVVAFLIAWRQGDPLRDLLTLFGVVGALFAGAIALAYALLGVAWVTVDEDGIRAQTRRGRSFAAGWNELSEVYLADVWWRDGDWRIRTKKGHLFRIRDLGFSIRDWMMLTQHIYAFQPIIPTAAPPGVLTPPTKREDSTEAQPVEAIYQARHESARWWDFPFFAVCLIVGLVAGIPRWLDGTWAEEPMLTVFTPLASAAILGLFVDSLRLSVRRATFLPEAVLIERHVFKPVRVPYRAIIDGFGHKLTTKKGRFLLGNRNHEAFWRLLNPHLQPGQLSGDMRSSVIRGLPVAMYMVVFYLPCFVILRVLDRKAFDLTTVWGMLYYGFGLFVLVLALGYTAAWLHRRWLLARSDDARSADDA